MFKILSSSVAILLLTLNVAKSDTLHGPFQWTISSGTKVLDGFTKENSFCFMSSTRSDATNPRVVAKFPNPEDRLKTSAGVILASGTWTIVGNASTTYVGAYCMKK